mmetsp:Transcript_86883/g.127075  ORF Transcript_86883/g.127075 Transcript_86883/m.127075 type:complete len:88 (+) Transcript_86883:49-312(+)
MAVACGDGFTAVVMEKGDLWSFGKGEWGELGLGTDADQLLPACVGGAEEVFGGEAVVMVAARYAHTPTHTQSAHSLRDGEGHALELG